jgi:DNA-binding MurR/RpiR family transcriptional regulator
MVNLGKEDVLIGFTFGHQHREISWILRRVQRRGATSILVTDTRGLMLRPSPTHLLAAPRSPDHRGHIAPLLICYALEYAIAEFAPDRVAASLELLAELGHASGIPDEVDSDHLYQIIGPSRGTGNGARRKKSEPNPTN